MLPVADQRILRGVSATLSWQNVGGDGEVAAPSGAVTVGVTRDDGTVLVAPGAATTGTGSGPRTYALAASDNTLLDLLTATWTDAGDGSTHTTYVEVVGGYYFSIAEARASDATLADAAKYPDATIVEVRREVEEEFERICDVAFVPRYGSQIVSGTNQSSFLLDQNAVRSVRSVWSYSDTTNYTAWTATEIASLHTEDGRVTSRTGVPFTYGAVNLRIAYEHGLSRPPAEVKRAALQRLRDRLNQAKTGIPDRATSFAVAEGGTYRLDQAGPYKTGMPNVDATLARWSHRIPGIA